MSPISSRNSVPRWARSRQPGAVEIDEGLLMPPAVLMEPGGEDTLARARLALDEDGAIGLQDFLHVGLEVANGRTGAGKRVDGATRFLGLLGELGLAVALPFQCAIEYHQQRRQLDRLGQEMIGARLTGGHAEADAA